MGSISCGRGLPGLLPCDGCVCELRHVEVTRELSLCGKDGFVPCASCVEGCPFHGAPMETTGDSDAFEPWVGISDEEIEALAASQDQLEPEPQVERVSPRERLDKLIEELNPKQLEASAHLMGPARVTAGAGSGKTKTLVARVARLMIHHGVAPGQICLISFTCKAASEIRHRIHATLGHSERSSRGGDITAGTFHSVCLSLLREEVEAYGRQGNPTVWDDDTSSREMARIGKELWAQEHPEPRDKPDWKPGDLLELLDRHREAGGTWPSDAFDTKVLRRYGEEAVKVLHAYQGEKVSSNAFDYGDLVSLVVERAERDEDFKAKLGSRWSYVVVDEYQDTNALQEKLLTHIAAHGNLMVIGDDDQSIYAFRGSDVSFILGFPERWPGSSLYHLGQNYRSTPQIVALADKIIRRARGRQNKPIWTENPSGDQVSLFTAPNQSIEAREISGLVARKIEAGAKPSDCAILARTRMQLNYLERALVEQDLRVDLVGMVPWWKREDTKEVLAWFRVLLNPLDTAAGAAVISRFPGLGQKTVSAWRSAVRLSEGDVLMAPIQALLQQNHFRPATVRGCALQTLQDRYARYREHLRSFDGPAVLAMALYEDCGINDELRKDLSEVDVAGLREIESRRQHRASLLSVAARCTECGYDGVRELLDAIFTRSDDDELSGRVVLSTIHAAKGLEWDHVWVAGVIDGRLPYGQISEHAPSGLGDQSGEEERRLAYVAVTRAKRTLTLTRFERVLSDKGIEMDARKSTFWLDAEEVIAESSPKPAAGPNKIRLSDISRKRRPSR